MIDFAGGDDGRFVGCPHPADGGVDVFVGDVLATTDDHLQAPAWIPNKDDKNSQTVNCLARHGFAPSNSPSNAESDLLRYFRDLSDLTRIRGATKFLSKNIRHSPKPQAGCAIRGCSGVENRAIDSVRQKKRGPDGTPQTHRNGAKITLLRLPLLLRPHRRHHRQGQQAPEGWPQRSHGRWSAWCLRAGRSRKW